MEETTRFLTRAPGRTERLCTDRQRQGGAILDDQEFRFGHLECEMPVNSSLKVGTLREVQAGDVSLGNTNIEGGLKPLRLDEITKGLNITREVMKMGFFLFPKRPPHQFPLPPVLSFTLLLHNPTKGEGLLSLGQAQVLRERRDCPASATSVTARHLQVL